MDLKKEKIDIIVESAKRFTEEVKCLSKLDTTDVVSRTVFEYQNVEVVSKIDYNRIEKFSIATQLFNGSSPAKVIIVGPTDEAYIKFISPVAPDDYSYYELSSVEEGITLVALVKMLFRDRRIIKDPDNWHFQCAFYLMQLLYSDSDKTPKEILDDLIKSLNDSYNKNKTNGVVEPFYVEGRHSIIASDWKEQAFAVIQYFSDSRRNEISKTISFPLSALESKY